ncbi:MAG: hypothetical protein HDR08_01795 [Lachnospiraceae bacterium]|nr:hypothetical protein [Lachnospiraceae bacterium]
MTPLMLQDDLVEEIKSMFRGLLYRTPSGGRVPLNVFAQNIPVNQTDEEDEPYPYVIVRLASGGDSGKGDSFNTVEIAMVIGTWDDSADAQGHRDVMNIIQKIYERFHENPCLNSRAVYAGEFEWVMREDLYYPYFFGACGMAFRIPAIRKEDSLA